jgi:precorrin-3B synthase
VDPVGVHAQRDAGRVWVGARVVLGRLDVGQLGALARVAAAYGSELRITPWRGVVLTDVEVEHADDVVRALEDSGLVCDPGHPANVVIACAGSGGCAAGLVDAQRDARVLVDALARLPRSQRPASVHVSGCEKGCACPHPTAVSLVGSAPDRYDVYVDSPDAGSRFGRRQSASVAPREAIRGTFAVEARS